MQEPNDETKLLLGFLFGFILIGVLGVRGCGNSTRADIENQRQTAETARATDQQRNETLRTCLQKGNAPLECAQVK